MPCYNPLQAFYAIDGSVQFCNESAKQFSAGFSPSSNIFSLPCGRCMGCRLEYSRQWAMRCMHEASLYENNCFITLTYSDDNLPKDGSLNKKHFQDFMKRLRRKYVPQMPKGLSEEEATTWSLEHSIRYYHCGEYGERLSRPHYHACLFNFDFDDKVLFKVENDVRIFVSASLTDVWGLGHCTVGSLTFDSAAYVARYCTKKISGSAAVDHYQGRLPEYATMSRKPGIGRGWYEKFTSDVFPSDFLVQNGAKMKPPRYYDNIFKDLNPELFDEIRSRRILKADVHSSDSTFRRLKDREKCLSFKLNRLKRPLEV